MEKVESVVIGAGVIGLAVARQLALAGREVIILEKNAAIGEETSARNSEVIHAGIYYPSGSLKARHCVAGKKALYDLCASRSVPHKRLGKLIVATSDEELPKLQAIKAQAAANGVDDLSFLSQAEVRALEPDLQTAGALLSPSTGIVDSHALMLALLGEAEDKGAILALKAPVLRGAITNEGFRLEVGGEQPLELGCRILINAAGHGAWAMARGLKGYPQSRVPPRHLAKGSYFTLLGKTPFQRLVYPVPTMGGLGTHLTLDMDGRARFGPDVEWLNPDAPLDYAVDPARGDSFYAAIRRYWPALPGGALQAGYSGIRPKLSGPKDSAADFLIEGSATHGIKGLVQLFGIESPGLTSCLSIAADVAERFLP